MLSLWALAERGTKHMSMWLTLIDKFSMGYNS